MSYYCTSCGVVEVDIEGIYCDACCNDVCEWLFAAEKEREVYLQQEAKRYERLAEECRYQQQFSLYPLNDM